MLRSSQSNFTEGVHAGMREPEQEAKNDRLSCLTKEFSASETDLAATAEDRRCHYTVWSAGGVGE